MRRVGAARLSQEMRDFSSQHGVALVDLHDRFSELLADGGTRSRYFHTETEGHPNPRGYAEVAKLIADRYEPLDTAEP